jgi:hypothetical protein
VTAEQERAGKARRMEEVIRGYFDACNTGDADAVARFFAPGAVHYFPPDMYEGPFRGDEWYHFDPGSGLIAEIRAYYASPASTGLDRLELGGYPYAERGYAAT